MSITKILLFITWIIAVVATLIFLPYLAKHPLAIAIEVAPLIIFFLAPWKKKELRHKQKP